MHPSTPSCIAVPSTSESESGDHRFMTGAYDGIVRLWDLRSTKSAVTSFKVWDGGLAGGGGRKVLTVDWSGGVAVIGGEGGVDVWRIGADAS